MSKQTLWRAAAILGCVLTTGLSACDATPPRLDESAAARAATPVRFRYGFADGGRTVARVDRRISGDGSESLHGETVFTEQAFTTRVVEDVSIDASGRLAQARIEIASGAAESPVVRDISIDAQGRRVTLAEPAGARTWSVEGDAPLVYAPLLVASANGSALATPIAAWVARRAAEASEAPWLLDGAALGDQPASRDQIVVDDGGTRWIVLGDAVFESDDDFVTALPAHTERVWCATRAGLELGSSRRVARAERRPSP